MELRLSCTNPSICLCHYVKKEEHDHDDFIKWKHFPCYWPFMWGIHQSLVNSPHKGQWLGALIFSLICFWTNGWVNNRDVGDLRRPHAHYDVTVMIFHTDWETKSYWSIVYLQGNDSIWRCHCTGIGTPICGDKTILRLSYLHNEYFCSC